MIKESDEFQFLMGDDELPSFKKALKEFEGEMTRTKIRLEPKVKNVGYISFVKDEEVKKDG